MTNTGGNYMDYTYDTIGQLKTATGKRANGTTRNHEAFGYHYDNRGNLERKTNNNFVQSFTLGAYNQLAGRSRSGTYTLRGMTSSNASSVNVTLNGGVSSPATLLSEDNTFYRNFTLANGNNTFVASGSDASSRTSTDTVTAYLPSTGSFLYDLNGNLTNDQQRVFIYDQENQLTTVLVSSSWKSEFVYDGFGRRRIRKEFEWQNSAWVQSDEVRYIYDGKLVIEERDRFNNSRVTYTRGTDLSGTREGAGGIGGLLARYDHVTQQPAIYHGDSGGNITTMVNANQTVVAKYIYDPFGHVLGKSGPLAEANLYRFSSKEEHQKSALVYYLYRYYDSMLQRWLNRDPIGEMGGINLYASFQNNPPSNYDKFGLTSHSAGSTPQNPNTPAPDPCKTGLSQPCTAWQNAPVGKKDLTDCLMCCAQTFSKNAKKISLKNIGWKAWFAQCKAACMASDGEAGPNLPAPGTGLPPVTTTPLPDLPDAPASP